MYDDSKTCTDCGLALPIAHERRGGCLYQQIRAELQRSCTPWTDADDRMARWLAGLQEPTTEWVLSLVRRALTSTTPKTSPCCGASIGATLGDGVLIGWCNKCLESVCRVNPRTGVTEWLDGASPWAPGDLRPVGEEKPQS